MFNIRTLVEYPFYQSISRNSHERQGIIKNMQMNGLREGVFLIIV